MLEPPKGAVGTTAGSLSRHQLPAPASPRAVPPMGLRRVGTQCFVFFFGGGPPLQISNTTRGCGSVWLSLPSPSACHHRPCPQPSAKTTSGQRGLFGVG